MANGSLSSIMGDKSTRVTNHFDEINTRARNIFKSAKKLGLTSNITELKKKSIESAIQDKGSLDYDKDRYLADFVRRVKLLEGNQPFTQKCKEMGLNPFSTATHLVFLGMKKIKQVLIDDVLAYGVPQFEYYPDWNTPIFEESDLLKRFTAIAEIPAAPKTE